MSEVKSFTLTIDGKPQGKPRARFRAGQKPYPDKAQKLAEGEIRRAWEQAGRPRLPDAALTLVVTLIVARPEAHFRRDGSLSAEGMRCPYPHKCKPDLDNALKLVCDALNTLAWRDDVRFVAMSCARYWGVYPRTDITAEVAWVAPQMEAAEPEPCEHTFVADPGMNDSLIRYCDACGVVEP